MDLLGLNISIYELEGQSKHDHDRAYYVITTGDRCRTGIEKNEMATNIYAPFMKGLTDCAVYGDVLVCTADELESDEQQGASASCCEPLSRD